MASPLIRALAAGYLVLLPIAAQASDTSTTVRVDLRALDLAAPDDMKTAHRRIDRAAKAACRNDVEHLTVKARRAARQCRSALRELAVQKLRARAPATGGAMTRGGVPATVAYRHRLQ